jgi:hypothetical protein
MKILHCSLALGLLLPGCATQYSPPAGSATTTVVLVAPAEEMFGLGQTFSVVSGEDCANGSILAGFNPMSSERSTSRLLPVGTRQFIRAGLSNTRTFLLVRSCINLVSFVPTEGMKYRMRHRFEGETCQVELLQDDGKAPATLQSHNARACR